MSKKQCGENNNTEKEASLERFSLGDGGCLRFDTGSIDVKISRRKEKSEEAEESKTIYIAEMIQSLDGLEAGTIKEGALKENGKVTFDFIFGLIGRLRFDYTPATRKISGGFGNNGMSLSPEWISERVEITQK